MLVREACLTASRKRFLRRVEEAYALPVDGQWGGGLGQEAVQFLFYSFE